MQECYNIPKEKTIHSIYIKPLLKVFYNHLKESMIKTIISVISLIMISNAILANTTYDKTILGIDRIEEFHYLFKDKKTGLITNKTGVNNQGTSTIDIMKSQTLLQALFSPEHGIRGDTDAGKNIADHKDSKTSLPVFSLYGGEEKLAPSYEMLKDVDILAYDIQDVGARFYTYASTMAKAMQACAKYNKEFVVFDRPNPLSGSIVEGGAITSGYASFVGLIPTPIRYGLTPGELAIYINKKMNINCTLHIIPMKNWKRKMFWSDTGLKWIAPSPNIPTPNAALIYAGTCLLEGTNISEGRGTEKPFTIIGAPWIDSKQLSEKMNKLNLDGATFSPISFTPKNNKYKGEECHGIEIIITDKNKFRAVSTGVAIIYTIKSLYSDKFEYREPKNNERWWIDLLTGSPLMRIGNLSLLQLINRWNLYSDMFKKETANYYLYD